MLPSSCTISLQAHTCIINELPKAFFSSKFFGRINPFIEERNQPLSSAAAGLGHADSRRCGRPQAEQVQEHSTRRGQLGGVPRHPQEGGGDPSTDRRGGGEDARRKPAG